MLILIITTAVIVMIKRLPYLFVGWMWYTITIAPVIGIIQVSIKTPYAPVFCRFHDASCSLFIGYHVIIIFNVLRKS